MKLFEKSLGEPVSETEVAVWWLDHSLNKYIDHKISDYGVLYTGTVWIVKTKVDGLFTRLLIEKGEVVYENQNLEAMACHIDMVLLALTTSKEK